MAIGEGTSEISAPGHRPSGPGTVTISMAHPLVDLAREADSTLSGHRRDPGRARPAGRRPPCGLFISSMTGRCRGVGRGPARPVAAASGPIPDVVPGGRAPGDQTSAVDDPRCPSVALDEGGRCRHHRLPAQPPRTSHGEDELDPARYGVIVEGQWWAPGAAPAWHSRHRDSRAAVELTRRKAFIGAAEPVSSIVSRPIS